MKRTLAALFSLVMALTVFAGCGSDSSSAGAASQAPAVTAAESTADTASALTEPDFLDKLTGGTTDYYNMSLADFSAAAGYELSQKNCTVFSDEGNGDLYAKYFVGKKNSILGGRVSLAKEYDTFCTVTFKGDKLKKMTVRLEGLTQEEADAVLDGFLKALEGKLPEGYAAFKPVEHKKSREVGYTKEKDDFCVSMKRDDTLDGDFYAEFGLEVYAERYGM